ncbi:hypothetical protein EJ04DRAFT_539603 [Polyplosphaeria fusca]|uniref:PH domain-containing protein n=1 Tax=Polyplosphaeria fusca TaxID=682080 RepID=A0A9P4RCA7_9PLEO|nr:hypothetical protein EJ04DRAFT_539603 [Polyplosphaeria fusca]
MARRRDTLAWRSRQRNSSRRNDDSERTPPTYGYHNTFHTHVQPHSDLPPPTYDVANCPKTLTRLSSIARIEKSALNRPPPSYTCTVELSGMLALRQELCSPFQVSGHREWNDAFLVLRGTQLCVYQVKHPSLLSKKKATRPGRLLKSYSLQHAEVGVAGDFRKTNLVPRSPFAHLVPVSARHRLFETDPHLFEPVREHVIRLRIETEQFLLCTVTQTEMLDWVEALCAAIDISPPLEDRSEPRYRSLPRRSRRQRMIDGSRVGANLETLSSVDAGRRIIAEQERIIRELYPHLAEANTAEQEREPREIHHANTAADPETDDLDPEDARFPGSMNRTPSRDGGLLRVDSHGRPTSSSTDSSFDPKNAPPYQHSTSQALRYRRRCAPVLLAASPRVSDVVFCNDKRMRINVKEHVLVEYASHPPRYDVHNFPKKTKSRPAPLSKATATSLPLRPASPIRELSSSSFASSLNDNFGYDITASSSEQTGDEIRSVPPSEPPSPTAATQAKADAARQLSNMGKRRGSEEGVNGLSAVALGVGLLI